VECCFSITEINQDGERANREDISISKTAGSTNQLAQLKSKHGKMKDAGSDFC
jgi:hypothetical protein